MSHRSMSVGVILGLIPGLLMVFQPTLRARGQAAAPPHTITLVNTTKRPAPPCPPGLPLKSISPAFGAAEGRFPVWAVGLRAVLSSSFATPFGPGYKVLWVTTVGYTGRITVRGSGVRGGPALSFKFNDVVQRTPVRVLILDPTHPLASAPGAAARAQFPTMLYVPKAGCYALEARSSHGVWTMTFEAKP
jgi:hypothetical protein